MDPEEWDFPPKPRWMRWKTYNRYETSFDRYDGIQRLIWRRYRATKSGSDFNRPLRYPRSGIA
jgi:hypothetical protein